jgi:hypothetical protein
MIFDDYFNKERKFWSMFHAIILDLIKIASILNVNNLLLTFLYLYKNYIEFQIRVFFNLKFLFLLKLSTTICFYGAD